MSSLAFLEPSLPHLIILGIVLLLIFGRRLPEVGRNLGRGITEFKKGMRDVTAESLDDPQNQSGQNQPGYQQGAAPGQPSTRAYVPPPAQQPAPRLPPQQPMAQTAARTSKADLVD